MTSYYERKVIIAFSNEEDLKKEQSKSGDIYLRNLLVLINQ